MIEGVVAPLSTASLNPNLASFYYLKAQQFEAESKRAQVLGAQQVSHLEQKQTMEQREFMHSNEFQAGYNLAPNSLNGMSAYDHYGATMSQVGPHPSAHRMSTVSIPGIGSDPAQSGQYLYRPPSYELIPPTSTGAIPQPSMNLGVDQLANSMGNMNLSSGNSVSNSKLVLEPGLMMKPQTVPLQGQRTMYNEKATLYKTELCKKWQNSGTCRYGSKCQFAHGSHELRTLIRHPLYKTTMCKTFQATGTCRYGSRCRFIHNETHHQLSTVPRMHVGNNAPPASTMKLAPESMDQAELSSGLQTSANGGLISTSPPNTGLMSADTLDHPSPSLGSVRFNNAVNVNNVDTTMPVEEVPGNGEHAEIAELKQSSMFPSVSKLGKRIPSAPASLNLMGLQRGDSLRLGMDDEEDFDFSYVNNLPSRERFDSDDLQLRRHASQPMHRVSSQVGVRRSLLRHEALKRNMTHNGLNNLALAGGESASPSTDEYVEQKTGFKLSSQYRHTSASLSNFPRNWSFQDKDELIGPSISAKDMPVARPPSQESDYGGLEIGSPPTVRGLNASPSKLNPLLTSRESRSFQNLSNITDPGNEDSHFDASSRQNSRGNLGIQFYRRLGDSKLKELH